MTRVRPLVLLALLAACAAFAAPAQAAIGPAERISPASPDASDVDVDANPAGVGAVAWSQDGRVHARRLSPDGTLAAPLNLSGLAVDDPGTRTDTLPDVSVSASGAVHIAFISENVTGSGTDRRVFVASADGPDKGFSVKRASTAGVAGEVPSPDDRVRVAAEADGRATVVWVTASGRLLAATRPAPSLGSEPAFAAPVELDAAGAVNPAIAAGRSGGPVTVAWSDVLLNHAFARTRLQGAASFQPQQQVDDGPGTAGNGARTPEVAIRDADGRSLVAFVQRDAQGADNVFLASRLADQYDEPAAVGTAGGSDDFDPSLAAAGSHVLIAWTSGNTPGSFRVVARSSSATTGPIVLGSPEGLSVAGTGAVNPSTAVEPLGRAVVAWNESQGGLRVLAAVRPGPADAFGPPQPLTANGDAGGAPAAAVYGDPARATVAFTNTRGADGRQVYAASGTVVDPAPVAFDAASYTVAEDATKLTGTVLRPAGGPAGSVRIKSADGAATGGAPATAGADYTAVDFVLSFAAGQTSRTFDVPVSQDRIDEQAERFTLTLTAESGNAAAGDPASAAVTITDDDVPVVFSSATYSVSETGGPLTIAVQRPAGGPAGSVRITSADDGAKAGSDYTAVDEIVTFETDQTTRSVDIQITPDATAEQPETFTLTLASNADNTAIGLPGTATVTIEEPVPGAVAFANAELSVAESAEARTISITRPDGGPAGSVLLRATGVSAVEGQDFQKLDTRITFAAGQTQAEAELRLVGDLRFEHDEVVRLDLIQEPDGLTVGVPSQSLLTIDDDDDPPALRVLDVSATEGEPVRARVVLEAPSGLPVTVRLATEPGSAGAGDFTPVTANLEIPAGEEGAQVEVPTIEDAQAESEERFVLRASEVQGARLTKETGEAVIRDDDAGRGPGGVPALPDPKLVSEPAPETLRTVRMPDFRPGKAKVSICGRRRICTAENVRAALTKLGLRNFKVVEVNGSLGSVIPRLRDEIEHGEVVSQDPKPKRPIGEPNLVAYPNAKLPVVKVFTYQDPRLQLKCDEKGLRAQLLYYPALWPGETTGKGRNRRFGAEDLLDRLNCKYRVKYSKSAKTKAPKITDVDPGNTVKLKVTLPKTVELELIKTEGQFDPELKNTVGLLADGTLPATGGGKGGLRVRVVQTSSAPSVPIPRALVVVTNGSGRFVTEGVTDRHGNVALKGSFQETGTYRLVALRLDDNGLSLDGETTLRVRGDVKSPLVTGGGRRFALRKGRWAPLDPVGGTSMAHASQDTASDLHGPLPVDDKCRPLPGYAYEVARFAAQQLELTLGDLQRATAPEAKEELTGRFVNRYLGLREAGLLERVEVQSFLARFKVAVANIGDKRLKAVTTLCNYLQTQDARRIARGFDLGGPLPAIEFDRSLVLPNGSQVTNLNLNLGSAIRAPQAFKPGEVRLERDVKLALLEAVALKAGVKLDQRLRDALAGVISTGGGNVVPTTGAPVISTGGGNLTVAQIRALFAVISTGGGNIIATDGASLTAAEQAVVNQVISVGGGNIIATDGASITVHQMRALLRCISVGGGNIIATDGASLTAAEQAALSQVISVGGGNLTAGLGIATGPPLTDALAGVISTGGGNLAGRSDLVQVIQAVISTGGGNIIATDGASLQDVKGILSKFATDAGLADVASVISTGGLNKGALIGQAGGNFINNNTGTRALTGR
jgi:hypothetical protein